MPPIIWLVENIPDGTLKVSTAIHKTFSFDQDLAKKIIDTEASMAT